VSPWKWRASEIRSVGARIRKIDGKIGCAFCSAGGWGGCMELACQSILTVLMNFGFLVFGVTDSVSRDMTLHYGVVSAKAPEEEQARAACRALGRRLAERTATYVHGIKTEHPGLTLAQRRPPNG
jgi:NAD(P)H dehydrogenase (quinone)